MAGWLPSIHSGHLRPAPAAAAVRLVRSLRRRQHRRGASACGRQSAQFPARHAVRDRSARRTPIRTRARSTTRRAQNFDDAARQRAARRGRRARRCISIGCGWARTSRRAGRLLLARRVRSRHHQEARAHAARQGRRSHAAHDRAPRADRRGVPDLSRRADVDRLQQTVTAGAAAVRLHRRRRRAAHDLAGQCRSRPRPLVAAFARIPALYIADGHHRAASAARARTELASVRVEWCNRRGHVHRRGVPRQPGADPAVQPHREGSRRARRRRSSSTACASAFRCAEGAATPARHGEVVDVPGRRAGTRWTSRLPSPRDASRAEQRSTSRACRPPCSSRCCSIGDVRTDKRIDFVGGARGTAALEQAVDSRQGGGRVLAATRSASTT